MKNLDFEEEFRVNYYNTSLQNTYYYNTFEINYYLKAI